MNSPTPWTASLSAPVLLIGALPLVWLVSNHYPPWASAWAEGLALALVGAASAFLRHPGAVPRTWLLALGLALFSVAAQAVFSADAFGGDLALAALYVLALAATTASGFAAQTHGLSERAVTRDDALAALALGLVVAGIAGVAVAWVQWLGVQVPSLFLVNIPPGGRPFGNLAQPNNFCTASFLALSALLLLRQWGRIGAWGFWFGAIWLISGMVMSGARAGWLQMAVVVLGAATLGGRWALRPGLRGTVVLLLVFAALTWAWPALNEAWGLSAGRHAEELMAGGTRRVHWAALADAVMREPFTGYGWGRVSAAQTRVAADHPFTGEPLEHSHNLLLDLLLWAGAPVGGAIALLITYWFVTRARACASATGYLWLVGLAGLFAHGLVEYPLEYAYFLMPAGLMIGAVESLHPSPSAMPIRPWVLRAVGLGGLGMLALVSWDYLRAEDGYRTMRFETARIGTNQTTPPPQLLLLSHLQAYQQLVQTTAKPGMSAEQLAWMRRVSERYPFPPVMLRYALAAGLNGDPAAAARTLKNICHMHPWERCAEARQAWPVLQARYPQLAAVPTPAMQSGPAKP
jgi:Virulence factor membrane-bound polymerase, C-terminal/O-Antigen ligase